MTKTFTDKQFCVWCGAKLNQVNSIQLTCEACGTHDFNNPKAAVVCIITNEREEMLVARRAHNPGKGKLDGPGGFIDAHETAEQAIIRELEEELGITVREDRLEILFTHTNTYPYQGIEYSVVDTYFHIKISSSIVIKPQDDVAEAHWVTPNTSVFEEFWSPQLATGFKRYFQSKNML